jgi:hypothetical protein
MEKISTGTKSGISKLYGYDPVEEQWIQIKSDSDGSQYTKQMVKDPDTLSWVPATQSVIKTDSLAVTASVTFPPTQEISDNPLDTWVSGVLTLTNATTAYRIPSSEQSARRVLILYNGSDTDMYIGASDVTTSTGVLLSAGATMSIGAGANLYAICASAGKILRYLEGK